MKTAINVINDLEGFVDSELPKMPEEENGYTIFEGKDGSKIKREDNLEWVTDSRFKDIWMLPSDKLLACKSHSTILLKKYFSLKPIKKKVVQDSQNNTQTNYFVLNNYNNKEKLKMLKIYMSIVDGRVILANEKGKFGETFIYNYGNNGRIGELRGIKTYYENGNFPYQINDLIDLRDLLKGNKRFDLDSVQLCVRKNDEFRQKEGNELYLSGIQFKDNKDIKTFEYEGNTIKMPNTVKFTI